MNNSLRNRIFNDSAPRFTVFLRPGRPEEKLREVFIIWINFKGFYLIQGTDFFTVHMDLSPELAFDSNSDYNVRLSFLLCGSA